METENMELSEQTKKDIEKARKEIQEGKVHRWEDIKKKLNLRLA